jgi:hypothetical protein
MVRKRVSALRIEPGAIRMPIMSQILQRLGKRTLVLCGTTKVTLFK